MNLHKCIGLLVLLLANAANAQDSAKWTLGGSVQTDFLLPQNDNRIGVADQQGKLLSNTYIDFNATNPLLEVGARLEYARQPLPGFEKEFSGWGLPHFYATGKFRNMEVTAGTFYEQFGAGFVLRTYEDRSLGIDNSLLGGRLIYRSLDGLVVKLLSGKQRHYWNYNAAWISGADVEYGWDVCNGKRLTLGGSFVNKNEKEDEVMADAFHVLNLPRSVNACALRATLSSGTINIVAEGAYKTHDPSFDNGYIYRKGYVGMLSATYSKRGVSLLAQVKRSDNMSFRSERTVSGISSNINHLPAFTLTHSYALPAMYPYATNANGEWAYQAALAYRFKPQTGLGGKYGTHIKLNFSLVKSTDRTPKLSSLSTVQGSDGYGSAFWRWGSQTYYRDLNVQIEKRITNNLRTKILYMHLFYNKMAIEGKGDEVNANIFVADTRYTLSRKVVLRTELQHLATRNDDGNWWYGLAELSFAPNWMFTLADMYNSGKTQLHYYQASATYNVGAHRLQVGYGRTRAGYNCVGGVCRYIPATKGLTFSYNYTF